MTISHDTYVTLALVWFHWVSDFVLQTDAMATQKSKSNYWLSIHVLVYSAILLFFGWKYALLNGVIHWCIDFCSSRISSKLWAEKKVHYFFVVIGFDQALHMSTLLLSRGLIR